MSTPSQIKKVLLSFVGNRDPYNDPESEEFGPVLSLLLERSFDEVILFCTGANYLERAKEVEALYKEQRQDVEFVILLLELQLVVDYEEIYHKLMEALRSLNFLGKEKKTEQALYILIDPGTPQIQTCWFLLARSGEVSAILLQGIPPQFGGGSYRVREINLDRMSLPTVLPLNRKEEYTHEDLIQLGRAECFTQAVEQALMVARYTDVSVVLRGEPGTGKELLARLIHKMSPRKDKPFVSINCSALSPNLVESELFGHMRGSFTGATKDRMGKFRAAEEGTVLLDEVGDLPLEIQPKLLRVLQEQTVQPVGSDKEYRVNIRVLAATNRDLEWMMDRGTFRRDLYDRLNQFSIHLPPLRERKVDIPILANHFLQEWNKKYKENKYLSKEVLDIFYRYEWPGNVRELQNTLIALCASSQGEVLKPECLTPTSAQNSFPIFPGRPFPIPNPGRRNESEDFSLPDGTLFLRTSTSPDWWK